MVRVERVTKVYGKTTAVQDISFAKHIPFPRILQQPGVKTFAPCFGFSDRRGTPNNGRDENPAPAAPFSTTRRLLGHVWSLISCDRLSMIAGAGLQRIVTGGVRFSLPGPAIPPPVFAILKRFGNNHDVVPETPRGTRE